MKIRLLLLALLGSAALFAQKPVKWSFSTKDAGNCQVDLIFTATIDDGWYTYSQFLESDEGPIPTSFTYAEGPHYKLVGKAAEGGDKITVYDNVFGMKLTKFKHKAIFTQRVEVKDPSKPIEGYLSFMVCDDNQCLPPNDVDFKFTVSCGTAPATPQPGDKPADGRSGGINPAATPDASAGQTAETPAVAPAPADGAAATTPDDANFKGFFDAKRDEINSAKFVNNCGVAETNDSSLWWVFIGGFLGGLVALLTPCVFPMIPMTVSFFVKRSKDRATGLRNALWYGSSIVVIYAGIGILLTSLFGATILNELSTNMWFNIAFFAIFIVFALSFFGMFEITLPSSWVNKSDQMADKGGMLGIFFMAATLALVSFSCTGPIVGTLLVETAKSNGGAALFDVIPVRPTVGMFGLTGAMRCRSRCLPCFPAGSIRCPNPAAGWTT